MAQPRSRSLRRIRVKTPSGRRAIHYRPRRKEKALCAGCGMRLHGVSHGRLTASKRNPSRPFAGVLCSACMRSELRRKVHGYV